MQINDIYVNLDKIGVNFKPNEQQEHAIQSLADFLDKENSSRTATLSGSAGTGKTACTKILLAYVDKLPYRKSYKVVLAAPTHKAKTVLKQLSGNGEVKTIHKLLGLKPDVDVLEFDATKIDFVNNMLLEDIDGVTDTLFIIDEGSMLNDDLFDFAFKQLVENAESSNKIIFIGDHKQLKPVGQTEISKVFKSTDLKLVLTKVERVVNGSVILDEITALRDSPAEVFSTIQNDISGIITYDKDPKGFMRMCRDLFIRSREDNSSNFCKVLAFTNKRVNQFNVAITKALKHTDPLTVGGVYAGNGSYQAPYVVSKHSYMYQNFIKQKGQHTLDLYERQPIIYDSADYILQYKEKTTVNVPYFQEDVPGYYIELFDTVDQKINSFYMLDPHLPAATYDSLARVIENIRLRAIDASTPYKSRKNYWSMWYRINDSFTSMYPLYYGTRIIRKANLVHGYSTTVHKSQGSSYNNVMVDINNVNQCIDLEARRELQYVALSRARSHIHLLQ